MLSDTSPVTRVLEGPVAVLTIDFPPVNAASQVVRAALMAHVEAADADPAIGAIVLACAGRTFTAGADIREFGKPPTSPILFEVCDALEACSKPIVVAIHGTALGGGMELALGAHVRIAASDAQIGFPEVRLGLVPGAGGTQRTPRLAGVLAAMELVASGKPISAKKAHELGLIDGIVEPDQLLLVAIGRARRLVGTIPRRSGMLAIPAFDNVAAQAALAAIQQQARGQVSLLEAAQLVLRAPELSLADGIALERETFLRLMVSDQGRALRHVFFAERAVAKVAGLEHVLPLHVAQVGVVGAGLMGAGIAVAVASAGYNTIIVEQSLDAMQRGRARVMALLERNLKSGRISQAAFDADVARCSFSAELVTLSACDLVIEAVFDDLAVKKDLFAKLDKIVRPDAILATNTSYLDPNAIAEGISNPARVVGMHFFSPANIMRLLEIVRSQHTSPQVLATALAVGHRLRKISVVAGVCQGFIGNRIYAVYRKQCEFLLEEGALPHDIDAAMEAFGLAMGPFKAFDMTGLEIAWALRKRLAPTRDPAERYVRIADRLCEMGRLGQKSLAGWYKYENGKAVVDPIVSEIVSDEARKSGRPQHHFSAGDIQLRLISAMINEGFRILEEDVASRASDIDLVFLHGYGWPAYLGGPMFQGELLGWARVLAEVRAMEHRDGPGWTPAASLVQRAEHIDTSAL